MLHFGIVTAVDAATCRVRATLEDYDELPTDWLPVLQAGGTRQNKAYSLPDVGEQVVCLMDAANENGVVLGAVYNTEDVPDAAVSAPGTWAQQLLENGAAKFRAVARRAAGTFALWASGRMDLESEDAVRVRAGAGLRFEAAGKLSAEANGENVYRLLVDVMDFLKTHKHAVSGNSTPFLAPNDITKIDALRARLDSLLEP